jgi:uncharacterized protein involved in exopolysaccharide biosynthesis
MKILVRRGRLDPVMTPTPTQSPQFERNEVTEEELNSEAELLQNQDILRTVVQDLGLADETWISKLIGDNSEKRIARAVKQLARKLEVEPARKATMIGVSYSSSDPDKSAAVLRCLSEAYLARQLQVRRPSGQLKFFDEQMAESRHGLETSELKLMNFSQEEGVVSGALERDLTLQKLSEADSSHRQTQVSIAEITRRLGALSAKLSVLPEHTTMQVKSSDNPQLLEKMKSTLLELSLKRTELLTKFNPSYRLVQEVEEQIEQTKAAISAQEVAPILEKTIEPDPDHEWTQSELIKSEVELSGLRARVRATDTLVRNYRLVAQELSARTIRQEELVRDAKAAEEKYLLYANKREEARIGDALDAGGILNVVLAEQPTLPVLPVWSEFNCGLVGFFLATGVSTGLAFVADYLNPSFRTPDDVVAYLGAPVLASLPRKQMSD